jgi:hypothetical protein
MGRHWGWVRVIILREEPIQSVLEYFSDDSIAIGIILGSSFNSFNKAIPAILLIKSQYTDTAPISLFRVSGNLQQLSNIILYDRGDSPCPSEELLRIPFGNELVSRRHMIAYGGKPQALKTPPMVGDLFFVMIDCHIGSRINDLDFTADIAVWYTIAVPVFIKLHIPTFHDRSLLKVFAFITMYR